MLYFEKSLRDFSGVISVLAFRCLVAIILTDLLLHTSSLHVLAVQS
jgi:hypothetical protein